MTAKIYTFRRRLFYFHQGRIKRFKYNLQSLKMLSQRTRFGAVNVICKLTYIWDFVLVLLIMLTMDFINRKK